MPSILTLKQISKRFGAVVVADQIDLTLLRGEALGIIGPNGAGKTTLFGIITGTVPPDGGRVVYGGGAITPDIIVPYDTLTSVEQRFDRILAAKSQESYLALYDYSFEMSKKLKPDFVVTQEMRDEFYQRLAKRGVAVERKDFDAAQSSVSRMLDFRISTLAFGDSTAKRRFVKEDAQLKKALELLRRGSTTKDLLAIAATTPSPSAKPER